VAGTIERVERTRAQDEEFNALVSRLVAGVQDHVEQQDTVLLPALVRACSAEDINLLSRQLRDGIPVARQAAERAGERTCGQADGDPCCGGFRVLLRRIADGSLTDATG
jgi:hypothetical protein